MFIKLTQLNGKPIWFNQQYIVTVEPRKGSGALVVPLGDGLDYEVLESPGAIIDAMGGSSAPAGKQVFAGNVPPKTSEVNPAKTEEPEFRIEGGLIVPAQATPSEDTVDDSEKSPVDEKKEEPAPKKTAARRTRKTASSAKSSGASKSAGEKPAATEASAGEKTAKKARTTARKSTASKKKAAQPPLPLTEDQLIRLQKMSPGSMRKLVNTLMSQFAVAETADVIDALCAREIISVTDQGHVNWNWRLSASTPES